MIPFGNKLRDYFHKYESGQNNIDAIIQALYAGQDELRKDNASIEQEKVNLWAIMGGSSSTSTWPKTLDTAVQQQVDDAPGDRPRSAPRSCRTTCSSTSGRSARTC